MRIISGQNTKLGRTIHGLAYNPVRDEIVVPNALADAILAFRADASGSERPLRVIQGPHTRLVTPHSVSLDLQNRRDSRGQPYGQAHQRLSLGR